MEDELFVKEINLTSEYENLFISLIPHEQVALDKKWEVCNSYFLILLLMI